MCDETAAAWRQQFPQRRIDTFGVDIRIAQNVEDMVGELFASGGLTGLVNNAAGNFIAPTESLGFCRAALTPLRALCSTALYVTPAIGKRWVDEAKAGAWQRGQPFRNVMSIITTWVDNGGPYVVLLAMSKAGIEVMTKSLAVEWARFGIPVNTIGPGEIPTEGMSKRLNPGEEPGAHSKKLNPMARTGEMSELQNLAAFLMAPGQCEGRRARAS